MFPETCLYVKISGKPLNINDQSILLKILETGPKWSIVNIGCLKGVSTCLFVDSGTLLYFHSLTLPLVNCLTLLLVDSAALFLLDSLALSVRHCLALLLVDSAALPLCHCRAFSVTDSGALLFIASAALLLRHCKKIVSVVSRYCLIILLEGQSKITSIALFLSHRRTLILIDSSALLLIYWKSFKIIIIIDSDQCPLPNFPPSHTAQSSLDNPQNDLSQSSHS